MPTNSNYFKGMIENHLHKKKEAESDTMRSFQELLSKHQPNRFTASKNPEKSPLPPADDHKRLLQVLMVIPWILAIGFVGSLFWDFDALSLFIFGHEFQLDGLLRMVCISGLIGFATNWLAIQMLFYPRSKRPLLGQGLVPAQKKRIATRLALSVERDLINSKHIKDRLTRDGQLRKYGLAAIRYVNSYVSNDAFRQDFRQLIEHYIENSLNDPEIRQSILDKAAELIEESISKSKLEKTAIRLYMLLKGKDMETLLDEALNALPGKISPALEPVDEILDRLPRRLYKQQDKIEAIFLTVIERALENINIQTIVEENLNSYDDLKLESMIRGATNTHLNYIKYLGAVIGCIGGLVLWNPWSLFLLTFTGGCVFALDRFLFRFKSDDAQESKHKE